MARPYWKLPPDTITIGGETITTWEIYCGMEILTDVVSCGDAFHVKVSCPTLDLYCDLSDEQYPRISLAAIADIAKDLVCAEIGKYLVRKGIRPELLEE